MGMAGGGPSHVQCFSCGNGGCHMSSSNDRKLLIVALSVWTGVQRLRLREQGGKWNRGKPMSHR